MKNLFKTTIFGLSLMAMSFTTKELITWNTDLVDMGIIAQGTPKTAEFILTNEGEKDLLITNVKASCGCTASDYTKEIIPAGKTGFVKATYNAANKGQFNKVITVFTSASETPKTLTIKGEVN